MGVRKKGFYAQKSQEVLLGITKTLVVKDFKHVKHIQGCGLFSICPSRPIPVLCLSQPHTVPWG